MKSSTGFSLIEILIALTLLSFVTISIITLTRDTAETKDRVIKEDEEKLNILAVLNRLEMDLTHLYSPLFFSTRMIRSRNAGELSPRQGYYIGNRRFPLLSNTALPLPLMTQDTPSEFEFFSLSHRRKVPDQKESYFTWIRYGLIPREDTPEENDQSGSYLLVRYSDPQNIYQRERIDRSKLPYQTLLRGVESLEFSFYDERQRKFLTPITTVANAEYLSRAIKVTIVTKDDKGRTQKVEQIIRPLWPFYDPVDDNAPNIGDANRRSSPNATPQGQAFGENL